VIPIIAVDEDGQDQHLASSDDDIDFSFVPKVLVEYCKTFIVTHHKLNGLFALPNILWHPETGKRHRYADLALTRQFKKLSSSRSSKKGNEGFILIAALILSAEILATGLAGWARRHPAAHQKSQGLVSGIRLSSRTRLTSSMSIRESSTC
jgi:hypothetical protein